jgi:uncharacterized protein involved in exopolysaccharide biosynthesis
MENYPVYEDEIDLRDLLLVLWRYRKMILGIFLAAVLAAGVLSFTMQPVYEVRTKVSLGYLSSSGTNPIHPLYTVPSYAKEMFLSEDFLRETAEEIGLNLSQTELNKLSKSIKTETPQDTNLIFITLETKHPQQGVVFLQKMIERYNKRSAQQFDRHQNLLEGELKHIDSDLNQLDKDLTRARALVDNLSPGDAGLAGDLQQARLMDTISRLEEQRQELLEKRLICQQEINSIERLQVLKKPELPAKPVRPRKMLNLAVAMVLGMMVGIFAAFTLDYFRRNPLRQE